MATKNVTIPKSYKGLKAVYVTPSEEGLLRRTSHPKGSPRPAKGPGGLLMMQGGNGEGLEEEARLAAVSKAEGEARDRHRAAGHYEVDTEAETYWVTPSGARAAPVPAPAPAAAVAATPAAAAAAAEPTAAAAAPAAAAASGSVMAIPATFARTRGGYDPDTSVDFTNTNPAYWASAVSYFKAHPDGNPVTGELGIWIPNLEKEGAERTALAAIAGGVTAHVDSNYANRTVTDEGRRTATESYRGGAEKAIRLAGTHRGGVLTETGYAMGSTAPSEHGVYIKGGVVVKGAGTDYVKGGGDFGGLLSRGDAITGDWLDSVLGARDADGLRIRGTYPGVSGATGSGIGAGGTKTSVGGLYGGGVDPLASMPKVADYTAYMDPNSIFGGLSKDAAVRSGLLYQPMASDYGAKMASAGMPAFSPTSGLLGSPSVGGVRAGGVGAPTYGAAPSGFSPAAIAAAGGGTAAVGSSAGLRDGLTAGMHSSHLGAYETADGTWVWGDRPGAYGDADSAGMGHGGPGPGGSYPDSPFADFAMPSLASIVGPGVSALSALISAGSPAYSIGGSADPGATALADEAAAEAEAFGFGSAAEAESFGDLYD